MKKILIYSNCHGQLLAHMFRKHTCTKNKFVVTHIGNYENLEKTMDLSHKNMVENCDVFIYQPFNKQYTYSEYDITKIKTYLKPNCIILRVNYYRFKGFWFESQHKPYHSYNGYSFAVDAKYYGIHNSFINFNGNKEEIIEKINNICINEQGFLNYFREELNSLKKIDDNSDVKMYDYFINNYKNKNLFNDGFHPTNLFLYEIFRQIVFKLTSDELIIEDTDFINLFSFNELTDWSLPILPRIKEILNINTSNIIPVFGGSKRIHMSIYDYYYIRLSKTNFQNFLNEYNTRIN